MVAIDYENNALNALAQFTADDPQYLLFNQSITTLIETEKQRDEAYQTEYQQITLTQLSTHEQWLTQYETQFNQLTTEQWQALSVGYHSLVVKREIPLFANFSSCMSVYYRLVKRIQTRYYFLYLGD